MTDAKDPKEGGSKEGGSGAKAGQPASVAAAPAVSPKTNTSGPRPAEREVQTREMQYMLGRRAPSALSPMALHGQEGSYDAEQIVKALSDLPDLTVVRRIRQSSLTVLSTTPSASHDIVVVRTTTRERADYLESMGRRNPMLIVERDHLLQHLGNFRPQFVGLPRTPTQVTTAAIPVTFHVQDAAGRPLANAEIVVYGNSGSEDQDKTGAQGDVTISVTGGYLNQVAALYVKPAADCWEKFIERPALDGAGVNTITLQPLSTHPQAGFPGQPGNPFYGYGQRIMGVLGLDLESCTGEGARVAIIDSGCDTKHPALSHITIGRDYTNLGQDQEPNQDTWKVDVISHGSHCAGVIAGNGRPGHIRGFAPKAEVHILKVFPGGAFNNLTAAIHYCIDNQIHVVNCSLGSDVVSELVAQAVDRARQAGVAIFVAAGNSATAVQFPASVPGVLCVSAIGQAGVVPDDTYHARTVPEGATVVPWQVYSAKFTCHGPQVGVCGPGVGIISSVPGGGYAAWDGTSMADPHLTGMGALLAAHHPALNRAAVRDAAWVDQLFALMRSVAEPVGLPAEYGGVGLPIVAKVIALSAAPRVAPQAQPLGEPVRTITEAVVNAVLKVLPQYMQSQQPGAPPHPGA